MFTSTLCRVILRSALHVLTLCHLDYNFTMIRFYNDMNFAFYGFVDLFMYLFAFCYPSLLLSWMFEHDWTHAVLGVSYACILYYFLCVLVQCN